MLGSWRGVTFQSTSFVQQCSLFGNHRAPKLNAEIYPTKRLSNTSGKKKIKCPQSKHSQQAKKLNQTFQKKEVSPIPNPQPNLNAHPSQSKPPQPKPPKKQQLPHLPPVHRPYQHKPPLHPRTINLVIHSPREVKEVRKYESPGHYKPLQFASSQTKVQKPIRIESSNSFHRLKTLEEFEPKMTQSVVNSTLDQIQVEESQIMIDFFRSPMTQPSTGMVERKGVELSDSDGSNK